MFQSNSKQILKTYLINNDFLIDIFKPNSFVIYASLEKPVGIMKSMSN